MNFHVNVAGNHPNEDHTKFTSNGLYSWIIFMGLEVQVSSTCLGNEMRHSKRMASDVGMQLFAQLSMARYSEILLSKREVFSFLFPT